MAILTVDEFREHVETAVGNDALQRLLDAAEEAIVARAGAPGERVELVGGGYRFISVARPIDSVTSIIETDSGGTEITLAADDYLIRNGDMLIERQRLGANARSHWHGRIAVTYVPVDDTSTREEVQIDLVRAALNFMPALTGQQIGSWSEQYAANSAWNNATERESILSRLSPGLGMVVV